MLLGILPLPHSSGYLFSATWAQRPRSGIRRRTLHYYRLIYPPSLPSYQLRKLSRASRTDTNPQKLSADRSLHKYTLYALTGMPPWLMGMQRPQVNCLYQHTNRLFYSDTHLCSVDPPTSQRFIFRVYQYEMQKISLIIPHFFLLPLAFF